MGNTSLVNKTCIPCMGGVLPLSSEEMEKLLKQLSHDWHLNEFDHLYKEFKFKDFMEAMNFANRIAELAEKEGHHPNLKISWGLCCVEIWTHKINGLSESDFILAAKINLLL